MPICLYISDALGKYNNLAKNKLYNSSNNINEQIQMQILKKFFLFVFSERKKQKGTITYINNKLDTPKNNTLLKQIYPPILPKFNISVL